MEQKARIEIEWNNRPYGDHLVSIALCFRGGDTTNKYIIDGKTVFRGNLAFYHVLFHYLRLISPFQEFRFDVQRAASTISFQTDENGCGQCLKEVLNAVYSNVFRVELFDKAYKTTKDSFLSNYKNGGFRGLYKAYEFSDMNKGFTLKTLLTDLEELNYDVFVDCANKLIVPGNTFIYITGNADEKEIRSIGTISYEEERNHQVLIGGVSYDPYLRQDANVVNVGREPVNYQIEVFDFLNKHFTNFSKMMVIEFAADCFVEKKPLIWVDSLDASIIFANEEPLRYKDKLLQMEESQFNVTKSNLLKQYLVLIENHPLLFAVKAASMMSIGIYVDQYLSMMSGITYEMFREMCDSGDIKVTEGQVILLKGGVK